MSVSNPRGLHERGFTLIEILIAITILSFITIGVVTITENSMLTKDRTTQLNADNLQIETAMSRFEWDFSQIYSPMYFSSPMNFNQTGTAGGVQGVQGSGDQSGFDQSAGFGGGGFGAGGAIQSGGALSGGDPGTQQNPALAAYAENLAIRMQTNEHFKNVSKEGMPIPRFYAPEKNIFEFFTSSNRRKIENTKQSHFGWVRYTLGDPVERTEEIDNGTTKVAEIPKGLKSLVRYYTADDPYSDKRINPESSTEGEEVKASVLLEHVENLEFQYWNLQTRKWETSLKAIANGESIIHGVRIILSWYDSQGLKRTTDRIFRTHWPIATPQDTVQPTGGAIGSAQGANGTAGANATAGAQAQAGANGGVDPDDGN